MRAATSVAAAGVAAASAYAFTKRDKKTGMSAEPPVLSKPLHALVPTREAQINALKCVFFRLFGNVAW